MGGAELPVVECDPVLVKQVFQNLLANALKFTRPRAHAIIEVGHSKKEEDGQTVFMVRDNGIGFNMKYVDKLFGVFQRLHRAEDFEGTGIGLGDGATHRAKARRAGCGRRRKSTKARPFISRSGGKPSGKQKAMELRLEADHELR